MASAVCLLVVLLIACAAESQEPVFFNQQLKFRYDAFRFADSDKASQAYATYDFELGMPLLTYRLGSLAFNGALEYQRAELSGSKSGDLGLNRYGLNAFLFPYRPYKLSLFYMRSKAPSLFGLEGATGNTFGLDFYVRFNKIPPLRFNMQRGSTSREIGDQGWSVWSLSGQDTIAKTHYDFKAYRRTYFTTFENFEYSLAANALEMNTRTPFSRRWSLQTGFGLGVGGGTSSIDVSGILQGQWDKWNSSTTGMFRKSPGSHSTSVSEGLGYSRGRWAGYALVSAFLAALPSEETPSINGFSFTNGARFRLTSNWSLAGDISMTSFSSKEDLFGKTARTYHVGLSRGGQMPELMRRSLFFINDLIYKSKLNSEFPPGYIPGEVAQEIMRRRAEHGGDLGFSADYWQTKMKETGEGKKARVSGSIRLNMGLSSSLVADWEKDQDFPIEGMDQETRVLFGNLSYSFGRSSLFGTAGYTSGKQTQTGIEGASVGNSKNYALGFNSQLWKMPYGILVRRHNFPFEPYTTNMTLHTSLHFRLVGMRFYYEKNWSEKQKEYDRIGVEITRLFDRILLGNL